MAHPNHSQVADINTTVMSTVEAGVPLAQVSSRVSHNEKRDIESTDEKQGALAYSESRVSGQPHHHEDGRLAIVNDGSPFPVDPNLPEETHQLTVRAVLIGSILGLIVGTCPNELLGSILISVLLRRLQHLPWSQDRIYLWCWTLRCHLRICDHQATVSCTAREAWVRCLTLSNALVDLSSVVVTLGPKKTQLSRLLLPRRAA